MMAALRGFVIAAGLAYLAILLFMYLQQRSLQYFPSRMGTPPEALGLTGVRQEHLLTPDGEKLVIWYAPAAPGKPTILFFHGNGGELAGRRDRMAYYQSQGFGALFLSYRGYGGSTGTVSERGFITDALTAHDFLIGQNIAPENIMLVGESLGTGVAVQVAAQRKVAAVALEAPYTATADVASERYWWLPVSLLMKDQFRSRDYIAKVTAPLLIQHGDADGVIPVAQGRALFAMANEPKQLAILPGVGHDVLSDPAVWSREVEFFLSAVTPQ